MVIEILSTSNADAHARDQCSSASKDNTSKTTFENSKHVRTEKLKRVGGRLLINILYFVKSLNKCSKRGGGRRTSSVRP